MKPIKFHIVKSEEGIFEYHLSVDLDKFLEKTILGGKEGLSGKIVNQIDEWSDFYNNYCYTWQCEENIFLYLLIILRLVRNKKTFGIPCWDVSTYIDLVEKEYEHIDWQYSIECQLDENDNYINFKDIGFQKAKSAISQPENPNWTKDKENKTALFKINSVNEFMNLLKAVRYDVFGEINLFVLNDNHNPDSVINQLNSVNKPDLSKFLDNVFCMIDLVIGDDEGFQDYLLIKSKKDLTDSLKEITNYVTNRGIEYENELNSINTIAEFEKLLCNKFEIKL